MEKIVVLACGSEYDKNLISCLKMLFPECEIEVHPKKQLQRQVMIEPVTKRDRRNLIEENRDSCI